MTSWHRVQVQTLKASRVIVCLLLLTYLRVSTRCLAVNPALRLSGIFNQCDSADVTSYWMSRLSREVLLFSTWFINAAFGNKCEIYKLNSKRTKTLRSGRHTPASFASPLLFTTSPPSQFYLCISVCVKFISIIIHPGRCYGRASVQIACCEERIVSAGQARGHELRTEEPEPDWEREGSLPCPISSPWWWGQEGTREGVGGGRWREAAILQSTVGVLLYLHTHQPNYRFMRRKHTLTHPAHTPLADYPPAEAFCERVAWVNTPSLRARLWCKLLSVCVSWEREREREREIGEE